jgi:hypothetical protein
MLAMLLPTTLPTAIPGEPTRAACRLVISSGVEVPNPQGQPDQERRDAEPARERDAAPDQQFAPGHQQDEAERNVQDVHGRTLHAPGGRIGRTIRGGVRHRRRAGRATTRGARTPVALKW